MNRCLYLGLMFVLPALLSGQDPFFIHFYGNESAYNPALVGYKGSTSFSAKYKSQWAAGTVPAFRSTWVNFEESMPCNLLDYGLNLNYDEEGVGVFRTYDIGLKVAGTIPFDIGKSGNNIRLGLSLQRSVKTIDFTRLIFSDQLDPKFGLVDANGDPIPTGFVPPDESGSHPFFTPSAGFAYRILFNTGKKDLLRYFSAPLCIILILCSKTLLPVMKNLCLESGPGFRPGIPSSYPWIWFRILKRAEIFYY